MSEIWRGRLIYFFFLGGGLLLDFFGIIFNKEKFCRSKFRMDGWMDGWTDGWMDRRMNG